MQAQAYSIDNKNMTPTHPRLASASLTGTSSCKQGPTSPKLPQGNGKVSNTCTAKPKTIEQQAGLSRICPADAARDFDKAMEEAGMQGRVNSAEAWEKWQAMQLTEAARARAAAAEANEAASDVEMLEDGDWD